MGHKVDVVKSTKSKTGYVYISTTNTIDLYLETMAFSCDSSGEVTDWVNDLGCRRYSSPDEADIGHNKMIAEFID
jgi:hypothetical protein